MDDIAGKISELLSSPEGMDKIKQMAGALFSDGGINPTHQNLNDNTRDISTSEQQNNGDMLGQLLGNFANSGFSLPDGFDPLKLIGLMSALNSGADDKRAGLLLALKPHLSVDRQERVDKAVKLLKIASLLPVLKEQGLLDIL